MSETRVFTVAELNELEVTYNSDESKVISDNIANERRWSVTHKLIFQLKDQPKDEAWLVYYQKPATECQECDQWFDEKTVEAKLVRRKQKLVEVWE